MANIFTKTNDYAPKPDRNIFDGSFANNFTTRLGDLIPVFCKEVIPGDSFQIDSTFGLRFMPMVFPVQTRMKANLHFFYVRNRTLWKDWMDFVGKTKDGLVPPYLQFNQTQKQNLLTTGSLGDYMGLPTRSYGEYASEVTISTNWQKPNNATTFFTKYVSPQSALELFEAPSTDIFQPYSITDLKALDYVGISQYSNVTNLDLVDWTNEDVEFNIKFYPCNIGDYVSSSDLVIWLMHDDVLLAYGFADAVPQEPNTLVEISKLEYIDMTSLNTITFNSLKGSVNRIAYQLVFNDMSFGNLLFAASDNTQTYSSGTDFGSQDVADLDSSLNPFGSSSDKLHISALPFRAYEAIYNSFYRNPQNNPYILDGTPEYNKYIPTNEGGIDSTDYHIHKRNWEADFLTTAVQSPQQGIAPLVGIVNNGVFQFRDNDGNLYNARPDTNDDGNITGFKVSDSNVPVGAMQLLVDIANTGISINDFRNVNSFQRWLEKNMRFGLKYKDQIRSHYGVDVRFDELDMPEFIGGTSQPVVINQITNMSPTDSAPLGEYGGVGSCVGTSKNVISHYFDEHGFVIGILSVSPVPVYSQLLPKMFIKSSVFDYFFPEFGHIGMQPITYKEVAPLQAYRDSETSLGDAFGYQRAWYDYLANVDEVHGEFRTSLRDFLINRTFNNKPELVEDFLLIDNDQVNDVFAVQKDPDGNPISDDKILGQVYFDVKMKRPIPLFGIPRLE